MPLAKPLSKYKYGICILYIFIAYIIFTLSGCKTELTTTPVANAGEPQTVETGSTVQLKGSGRANFGGALTYLWSFSSIPDNSSATLSNPVTKKPTFIADVQGTYIVDLVVNNGNADSLVSQVTITVSTTPQNTAPVANAGPDRDVNTLTTVTLDGSASTDADLDSLVFTWSIISAPQNSNALLLSPTDIKPTFEADLDGVYSLQLIVNDGTEDSLEDTVTITASTPPIGDLSVFWVSKTGSDDNDCSSELLSCSSIQKVLNLIGPGETLNIKEGTYIEDPLDGFNSPTSSNCSMIGNNIGSLCVQSSGTVNEPIIIQAAPGHEGKVIIDGEGLRGGILIGSHDYIHIKNLNFHNSNLSGIRSWGQPQNAVANYETSSVGCLIEGNTIINTTGAYGLNVSAIGPWGSQNWVIRNNYIKSVSREQDGAASAIQAYGVINALVENNEFYDVKTGVFWKDHFLLDEENRLPVNESEIRNNVFATTDKSLYIGIKGTLTVEAGHNYIHHNIFYNHRNAEHGAITFEMAGAFAQSKNLRIEHNTIDGDGLAKIGISGDAYSDVRSKGNIVVGNANSYVFTKYSSDIKQVDLVYSDYNIFDDSFKADVDRYSAGNAFSYTTLPSWQQALAEDHVSLDVNNPDTNSTTSTRQVLFSDPDNRDYTNAPGSPAIGMMSDGSNAGAYQTGTEIIGLLPSHPMYTGNASAGLIHSETFTDMIIATDTGKGFSWMNGTNTDIVKDPLSSTDNDVLSFFFGGDPDLTDDAMAEQRFKLGAVYKTLWIKYRLFIPLNYYHRDAISSDNAKGYVMLWSGPYQGQNNQVATSWWPLEDGSTYMGTKWKDNGKPYSQHFFTDSRGVSRPKAIDLENDLGKWQDFVIGFRIADIGQSNGAIQVWKNGALMHSHIDIANWGADESLNGIESGYLLGWANAGFNEDTTLLIDDFMVGETAESISFDIQ